MVTLPLNKGPNFGRHVRAGVDESPQALLTGRDGFTIVEVIIAVVILAVGLLGVGGTTVLVVKQTTLADVTTERTAVLQSAIEELRALPYDSVVAGADTLGPFMVSWTVTDYGQWRDVVFVTEGPGLSQAEGFPALSPSVPDTFSYRIIRP
jgi:prepilin-type N-terminal cleavage/methylation domain-containing protein